MTKKLACSLLAVFCLASCLNSPTRPIHVTRGVPCEVYYKDLERRWVAWFKQQGKAPPEMPSASEVCASVSFEEADSSRLKTCIFVAPDRIIVGDDKWDSGCVPHELGHAALFMLGNECWNEFEHPGETC